MTDELDISSWFEDPSSKTIQIYSLFLKKALLDEVDRQKLKKDRGFTDDIIDLCQFKSCRPENREIIKELQGQFGEDALLEAGILQVGDDGIKPCGQLLGTYTSDGKFVNNICIPYFNSDGEIFYIRPHKFGLKNKGINIYCPTQKLTGDRTWIITESEFKAVAALQFGYPAIGLPGIHSFAVNNFDRLQEFIVSLAINNIVIIFDNEIKTNPQFKNYKPNVAKQWDTQWRAIDMCRKLLRKIPDLASVKIGVLPEAWMSEGKIDIDGALAQGRTAAEFKTVVYKAIDWNQYLDTVPTIGKKIIRRKIYTEDLLGRSKVKKKEAGYFLERSKKAGRDEPPMIYEESVSNFTMEIKKTLIEGGNHVREIMFRGQDGTLSTNPVIAQKGTNILRDFKSWVFSCGDYHFTGSQEDLDHIWTLEGALGDGREILRPEQIGYLKNNIEQPAWLFGNVMIKDDGAILLPDDDGIIWEGLTGYSPRSITEDASNSAHITKMPIINLSDVKFELSELRDLVDKMEKIYGTKSIRLAIGWIIACLFSDEIYKKYACFPILFIAGKRESGKSTLGNWLMAMVGLSDTAGDSLSATTIAGAERNLAWFNNLPYWLDEYRNNAKIKKWEGFFRNAYQRQGTSKGTLGTEIRSHSINAGIILSGEETPQDNAFLSRCIIIPLIKNRERSPESNEFFKEVEDLRTQGLLSRLVLEVIKVKSKLLPIILEHIDGWKKRFLAKKIGERIALNYAIPSVCYDAIFLRDKPPIERQDFMQWVIEESTKTELEKESEHMLAIFMEDLVTLHKDLGEFYSVFTQNSEPKGKRRIAIHFPTFYSKWTETFRRKGFEQFKRGTILSYIREELYFIDDNKLRRINGKPVRALILSLDPEDNPPDGLLYLADGVSTASDVNISETIRTLTDDEETPF